MREIELASGRLERCTIDAIGGSATLLERPPCVGTDAGIRNRDRDHRGDRRIVNNALPSVRLRSRSLVRAVKVRRCTSVASLSPQGARIDVASSDRHVVRPWFKGGSIRAECATFRRKASISSGRESIGWPTGRRRRSSISCAVLSSASIRGAARPSSRARGAMTL